MRTTMSATLLAGIFFDLFAHKIALVEFSGGSDYFIPVWLVTMWFLFAWIVPDLLSKFADRRYALSVVSAVFGPLSYFWGIGFHILKIDSYIFYLVYAVFWVVLMWTAHHYLFGTVLRSKSMAGSEY